MFWIITSVANSSFHRANPAGNNGYYVKSNINLSEQHHNWYLINILKQQGPQGPLLKDGSFGMFELETNEVVEPDAFEIDEEENVDQELAKGVEDFLEDNYFVEDRIVTLPTPEEQAVKDKRGKIQSRAIKRAMARKEANTVLEQGQAPEAEPTAVDWKPMCKTVAAPYAANVHPQGHSKTWRSPVAGHVPGKLMKVHHNNMYDTVYSPGIDVILFVYSSRDDKTQNWQQELTKLAEGMVGAPNVIIAAHDFDEEHILPVQGRVEICKTAWWEKISSISGGGNDAVYFFPSHTKRQYHGIHGMDSIVAVPHMHETWSEYEKLLHERGGAYTRTAASAKFFGVGAMERTEEGSKNKPQSNRIDLAGASYGGKVAHSEQAMEQDFGEPYRPIVENWGENRTADASKGVFRGWGLIGWLVVMFALVVALGIATMTGSGQVVPETNPKFTKKPGLLFSLKSGRDGHIMMSP